MHKVFYFTFLMLIVSCDPVKNTTMSSDKNSEEGFVNLFDGKTTNGWHSYGKTTAGDAWKVVDGALYFDAAAKKNNATGGDLVTNEEFENYHLKLEWKISPKGNSGIIFNIKDDPSKYDNTYNTGLEMQVLDNGTPTRVGHSDSRIFTHRAGDLYDLIASKEAIKPVGEWNAVEIVMNNGKLDFYMNGEHTLSTILMDDNWKAMKSISKFKDMADFGTIKKGKIALQDHGDEVWYRNIRIRKL